MEFENNPADVEHPLVMELEPGTYHWCTCGGTAEPPFCDGSHAGTEFEPIPFMVEETRKMTLCNCGMTGNPPHCDGSHLG